MKLLSNPLHMEPLFKEPVEMNCWKQSTQVAKAWLQYKVDSSTGDAAINSDVMWLSPSA